jgi:hypothetical protein
MAISDMVNYSRGRTLIGFNYDVKRVITCKLCVDK